MDDAIHSLSPHAEVRSLLALHIVSDSSSRPPNNGERPKLSGGLSNPGDTATRDEEKYERKSASAKTNSARGGVIQDKQARRRRTKSK